MVPTLGVHARLQFLSQEAAGVAFAALGYLLGRALGHDGAAARTKKESGHPVKSVRSFLSPRSKELIFADCPAGLAKYYTANLR